jgi:hypothetical protein
VSEQLDGEAAEKYFAAFERWDLETVESLVADDAVEGRPQSGERFVDRENIIGMLHSRPASHRSPGGASVEVDTRGRRKESSTTAKARST